MFNRFLVFYLNIVSYFEFRASNFQEGIIRLTRRTLITYLILATIFFSGGVVWLFNPFTQKAEAAWFNDNWGYRQSIPVDTHSAAENNVYISLTVDTASLTTDKLQADCDDLRFTKNDGTILPYQIVSGCDSATTSIRVGFDTMPVAPFYFYMYYGNPSASSGSVTLTHSACSNTCTAGTFASEEKVTTPIGYWKFDDGTGTTANDSTSNNSDGTITGSTWLTEDMCISGKCLRTDGSDDVVTMANESYFEGMSALTVSAWIKTPTSAPTSTNRIVIGKDDVDSQRSWGLIAYSSSNVDNPSKYYFFGFGSNNNYSDRFTSSSNLNDGQWHFFEVVWTVGSAPDIYVDGKLDNGTSSNSSSGTVKNTTSSVTIGASAASSLYYPGSFDEVRIYNYARSAAQVKADFNARSNPEGLAQVLGVNTQNQPAALSNGLVGYWKMDEAAGSASATDSSGNASTGSYTNGATTAAGKFGNGGSFDGSNDYIDMSDPTVLDTSSSTTTGWTMAVWAKPTGSTEDGYIISHASGSGGDGYFMYYEGSSDRVQMAFNCSLVSCYSTAVFTENSTWVHIVGTNDGSTTKIYRNGVLDSTNADTISTSNSGFRLGNRVGATGGNTGQHFAGTIDEARIYNRALSSAEVTQLYNFAPGPVAHWKMDEESGTRYDSSGYGNNLSENTTIPSGPGKYGKAAKFSAADQDYLSVADNASLSFENQSFTITSWVNLGGSGCDGFHAIVDKYSGAERSFSLRTAQDDVTCYFEFYTSTDYISASNAGSPQANRWYFVTAKWDGTQRCIAVDNAPFQCENGGAPVAGSNAVAVGAIYNNTNGWWEGKIDEVKIYNYVRTADQLTSDYNAGHPPVGSPVASAMGHWKFDEGALNTCSGGTNDACNSGSQGTTFDGAFNGDATYTQAGKFGKALSLDGTGDYVNFGSSNNIQSQDFTVSMWVNPGTQGAAITTILDYDHDTPGQGWVVQSENATTSKIYYLAYYDGSTYQYSATNGVTLTESVWQYITFVKSGTSVKAYKDATLSNTFTASSATVSYQSGSSLYLGRYVQSAARHFTGKIDEVKIYNYALTAEQVKLDMNNAKAQVLGALSDNSSYQKQAANQEYCIPGDSTSCAAPVGRWDFSENSGSTVYDTSGNNYSGTVSGTGFAPGKTGSGLKLDSQSDTVSMGDVALDGLSALTAQVWVKIDSSCVYAGDNGQPCTRIITKDDEASNRQFFFGLQQNGQLLGMIWTSSGTATRWSSSTGLNDGRWHHLALTWDRSTLTTPSFYVDGKLNNQSASSAAGTGTVTNTSSNLRFGDDDWGATHAGDNVGIKGMMDQVRIFNYARSAAQIAYDFNKGAPVGHWRLDECQGSTVKDSAGNSLTGTITVGGLGTETTIGTCNTSSTAWGDGATGKYNYSLSFDGTDDYVTISDNTLFDLPTDWSVSIWVNAGVNYVPNPTTPAVLAIGPDGGGFVIRIIDGKPYMYFNSLGGFGSSVTTTFAQNTWTHITVVKSGSSMYTYMNGVLQDTDSVSSSATVTTTNGMTLANDNGSGTNFDAFQGKLDDAKVFHYPLTATQVKQLYNENFSVRYGPTTGAP